MVVFAFANLQTVGSLFHNEPTGVDDGDGLALLVGDDLNEELLLSVELGRVGERLVADLVQSIGAVGDQLAEEDFLIRVEGVDDETHQLGNLCLECEEIGRAHV